MEYTKSAKTKTLHSLNEQVDSPNPQITVLGMGNLLLKDEGVGVHLISKLPSNDTGHLSPNIIDGGTSPDISSIVGGGIDKLIIVDAVKTGDKPGTMYRFSLDDLDMDSVIPISLHEIGVLDSLRMMALLNRQPKSTIIIGIEPKSIDYGLELSPEIEEKLPELIELVLKEVEETNIMMEVD